MEQQRSKDGATALHIASRRGQAAALGLLLDEGADINEKDDEGITPLLASIKWQCGEVLDILFERGARVNIEALHAAAAGGYVPILLRLLDGVAEINIKDEKERTMLHTAASVGTCEAVELLLKNGADVHAKDIMGETLLHKAVQRGRQDVVKALCRKGANINQHTHSGYTPLHLALKTNYLKRGRNPVKGLFMPWKRTSKQLKLAMRWWSCCLARGQRSMNAIFLKRQCSTWQLRGEM